MAALTGFWDWAVAAYGGEGVAHICLDLQDAHGQCVPLLLWAAWQASEGRDISESSAVEAASVARRWSEAVIEPLRGVRRRLKLTVSEGDENVRLPLREKIKAAELAAEKVVMTQLACLTPAEISTNSQEKQELDDICLRNIENVAHAWGEKYEATALIRLSQALTKGNFLRYNPPF